MSINDERIDERINGADELPSPSEMVLVFAGGFVGTVYGRLCPVRDTKLKEHRWPGWAIDTDPDGPLSFDGDGPNYFESDPSLIFWKRA